MNANGPNVFSVQLYESAFMSDVILLVSHSASVVNKAQKMYHWREGSSSPAIPPTCVFNIVDNKIGRIIFLTNSFERSTQALVCR